MSKNSSPKIDDKLVLGPAPRADLLPIELKQEARARGQRRAMVGVVVLAVVLVVAAYAYATINATIAHNSLLAAEARTASLLTEQSKYIEGKRVADQTAAISKAQTLGASTEVPWAPYYQLVAKSLPRGTYINIMSAATSAPGSALATPEEPLQEQSLGAINFQAITEGLPDVSKWIDNLSKLPGFADASAKTIERDEKTGKYTVTIIMHFNEGALSNRFQDKADSE